MAESIAAQVAKLEKMTLKELRAEWELVFGEPTQQRHRDHLWKRLAKKIQQDQLPGEQGVPDRPRKPVKNSTPTRTPTIPPPGTVLVRQHKGQDIVVTVLDEGFEYCGKVYRSLSAIAREVTGTVWSGPLFFGLKRRGRK